MKPSRIFIVLLVALAFTACSGGGDAQAFCDAQAELEDLDPADESAGDAFAELVDEAPEEIRGDVEQGADALGSPPNEDEGEAMQELVTAAQNIQDWVEENCEEG